MATAAIVWFRNDLRLADNPALRAAVEHGGPVVPVFIWAPEEEGNWPPGAASRWWLHHSLTRLDADLRTCGSRMLIRRGASLPILRSLAQETRADAVFWNRRYEPQPIERDTQIKKALRADGLHVETFNTGLLFEPSTMRTKASRPFQVFTPFWKACLAQTPPPDPLPSPAALPALLRSLDTVTVSALQLEPTIDWTTGLRNAWQPGEAGAVAQLDNFLEHTLVAYPDRRDHPDAAGTSRLSPHLHFGEISPRQVWHAVQLHTALERAPGTISAAEIYLRQLGWREFAHHLLYHFPHTTEAPLRSDFNKFPWHEDTAALKAWQRGRTGYPLVDAGMRELWATGWMHNRVRMIVASFLVKDLLLPWQSGARWFWDTLVDADLANNTLGWQWTAGCGADAAPYFRIFNPVSQGEKFDRSGDYVRRWIPELARLPAKWIHRPWDAPPAALRDASVQLGRNYPERLIDHAAARERALAAFARVRK